MKKGRKTQKNLFKVMILSLLCVLLSLGNVTVVDAQNFFYNEETIEGEETYTDPTNNEEYTEEVTPTEEPTTDPTIVPTVVPTVEPTEEPLPIEAPEVIEEETSINNKEEEEDEEEEEVIHIQPVEGEVIFGETAPLEALMEKKLSLGGMLKASRPNGDGSFTVTTWADLKRLIETGAYDGGTTTSNTLNISIKGDLVATSTITIPNGKTINLTSADANSTIYGGIDENNEKYKYDQMFLVEGGTLSLDNKITLSGKRAKDGGDECEEPIDPTNSYVNYTQHADATGLNFSNSVVSYQAYQAAVDCSLRPNYGLIYTENNNGYIYLTHDGKNYSFKHVSNDTTMYAYYNPATNNALNGTQDFHAIPADPGYEYIYYTAGLYRRFLKNDGSYKQVYGSKDNPQEGANNKDYMWSMTSSGIKAKEGVNFLYIEFSDDGYNKVVVKEPSSGTIPGCVAGQQVNPKLMLNGKEVKAQYDGNWHGFGTEGTDNNWGYPIRMWNTSTWGGLIQTNGESEATTLVSQSTYNDTNAYVLFFEYGGVTYYIGSDTSGNVKIKTWEQLDRTPGGNNDRWYYMTDGTLYNPKGDLKLYFDTASGAGSIKKVQANSTPRVEPTLKIGGTQIYADTGDSSVEGYYPIVQELDTPIYVYAINTDGTKGAEVSTGSLTNDAHYYLVANERYYLKPKATGDGAEWDLNFDAANSSEYSWKYVSTGTDNGYLISDTNDQVFFKDGDNIVIVSKNTKVVTPGCAGIADLPEDYIHTNDDFPTTSSDTNQKGYFIKATSGTVNINGAKLTDFQSDEVNNIAPVLIDNATFNMTAGEISNNHVSYQADDNKSGMQVTGSNTEGNGVKNYINSVTPTKSAGGAIFTNGAKASIYGDAAIKQNHGDVGGILANGTGTYVVVGGEFEPNCGYITQQGGHIDQNVGFHYAGAALVENGAVLRLVGTATMNHNVTWNRGGAVWATDWGTAATPNKNYKTKTVSNLNEKWEKEGVFIMTGGEMAYNTAFVRAGAVEVESNSVFLRQGYIHDNYCRSLGGAIYVEGDFRGIYWYTLHIEEGYIGQNYSVRFRNNMNETVTEIGGNYDGKTIEQMNNILDRKLGQEDADGNPLVDSYYVTYPRRTSDYGDFVTDRQYMGNGGGIWLCPLGGSVVVNLTDEHKVYVEHNYASGHYQGVQAKGTDFYLHKNPDGHLILINDYHLWIDENTGTPIETVYKIHSGALYLRNNTEQVNYDNTTHTVNVDDSPINGILIVNNVSRDGGGIAADGLVAFGTADETHEHGAEIELTKTWSEATDEKKPLVFKLFYLDKNGEEQPIMDENGIQSSFIVSQNTSGENDYNSSAIIDSWKARANVPNIVKIVENGEIVPYPLYLLNHPNYSGDLDPSDPRDVEKIAQLNADYPNAKFSIKERSLKLVIREYDEDGNEITDVALSDITLTNVDVTSSQINEYDENNCEYRTKANVHYSVAGLNATAVNGEQPAVEKYINGVVHKDLYSYDSVFEYEILAYVPLNATEFIIYDTLEKELMFWNAVKQIPQYTTDNSGNEIPNKAFDLSGGNIRIINENEQAIYMFTTNNHLGDGSANASVNQRKNGTKLTEIRNNNTGDYIIRYNLAQYFINGDEVTMPTNNVNNADTIFVKIDEDHIEKVRGKWIALSFNAGIRPSWKDVNKLKNKNEGTGWLVDYDNKTGSPIKSVYKIEGEALPSNLTGTAWEYVVGRGLEELVDLVDIVEIAKKPTEDNSSYRFAKDRYGNYYALKVQPSEETWSIVDEHADVFPTIQNVQDRMAENNSYGFTIYKPTKVYTYSFGQPEDHLIAALQESDQLHEGEVIIAGAFGEGKNMFAKTSEGRYFYRQKPSDLTDPTIWQTLTPWVEATASTSPTLAMAIDRVDNGNYLNRSQGDNGKMRLTYSYNWPVKNAQEPHSGEKNQAKYLVTTNKGKSTYKTNIVTVDVVQPEKYVNNKVHDILGVGTTNEGAFDEIIEYEIMVYVPDDATEVLVYDTLKDDLMFVDRFNNPQYKTYNVGTESNPTGEDVLNTEFNQKRGYNESPMISNSTLYGGNRLTYFDGNNHKGDGTGTVSGNGTPLNEPITKNQADTDLTNDYIILGDLVTDSNGKVTGCTPNNDGKSIFVKIDESTNIQAVRGKWLKVVFTAQIKPSRYDEIVKKISKENMYTSDANLKDPNYPNPVGYYYRLTEKTVFKENQKPGTNPTANVYYIKDADGKFTVRQTGPYPPTRADGSATVEGVDYRLEYVCDFIYFASKRADIPNTVATTDIQPVYVKKDWNKDDPTISWEMITDDGYVVDGEKLYTTTSEANKPIGVQENGDHAGLANKANYAVKIDNEYHYSTTNTVTVVPKEREIEVTKLWIVDEDTKLPTAEEFLEYIDLYWEYDKTASGEHNKQVGKITDLYKDNISVVYEATEIYGKSVRHIWKIRVTGLPKLNSNMHYFLKERHIPGYNLPEHSQEGHAHDKGKITNSLEESQEETHLKVEKTFSDGVALEEHTETIKVRLLGNGRTIYQRDADNKVVKVGGNPVQWEHAEKELNWSNRFVYEWRPLPRYQYDDNGNALYIKAGKTLEDYRAALDAGTLTDAEIATQFLTTDATQAANDNGALIHADIIYSIEVLSDPEGYILSIKDKKNINYHTGTTSDLEKAYNVETYTYEDGTTPAGRIVGTWKRAEVVAVEEITSEYVDDGIGNTTLVETGRRFLEGSELAQKLAELNATDRARFEEDCKNGAKSPGLPETPVPQEQYACYYRSVEEYETYEVDLTNTKPQIEKYINKDVHLETFFGNEFIYDIVVYVPNDATEIDIYDEILPTLKMKSFLEPIVDENDRVTGTTEFKVGNLDEEIKVVVRSTNNHTINGDVSSSEVFGDANAKIIHADENSFHLKVENIYSLERTENDFIPYEDGEYVKVHLLSNETDEKFVKADAIESGYVRKNTERYRKADETYYVLDENATVTNDSYIAVEKDGVFYKFMTKSEFETTYGTTPAQVDGHSYKYSNKAYRQISGQVDQAIGGKYVQVTFKAGFNLDVVDTDEFKSFLQSNASKPTSNDKEKWDEYDWDVIKRSYNKGWDDYIVSLGYTKGVNEYVLAANTVPSPIVELAMLIGKDNLSKAIVNGNKYYGALDNNGNYYVYPMNLTRDTQYNNQWFKITIGPKYYGVSNGVKKTDEQPFDGNRDYWYRTVESQVKDGTNLITNNTTFVPVVEGETYYKEVVEGQPDKYYLDWVVNEYAGDKKEAIIKNGTYKKIDWGRGDGDVIRNNTSPYSGDHAGIVNTASYEVTYGNKYKSTHKSNTVTVVPEVYSLPHSGGIGTYWHTILGTMLITLGGYYLLQERRKRKQGNAS